MAETKLKYSMGELMQNIEVKFTVTGVKIAMLRLKLGKALLHLATKIIGAGKFTIEYDPNQRG